jgi:hypothetical protein
MERKGKDRIRTCSGSHVIRLVNLDLDVQFKS